VAVTTGMDMAIYYTPVRFCYSNTAYIQIKHAVEKIGNIGLLVGLKGIGPFDFQTNYMILNMVSTGENTLRATARGRSIFSIPSFDRQPYYEKCEHFKQYPCEVRYGYRYCSKWRPNWNNRVAADDIESYVSQNRS